MQIAEKTKYSVTFFHFSVFIATIAVVEPD